MPSAKIIQGNPTVSAEGERMGRLPSSGALNDLDPLKYESHITQENQPQRKTLPLNLFLFFFFYLPDSDFLSFLPLHFVMFSDTPYWRLFKKGWVFCF